MPDYYITPEVFAHFPLGRGHSPLPPGVEAYKSPTSIVQLPGRIYCTLTPEDYGAVHKLQDEVKSLLLSAFGKDYVPGMLPLTSGAVRTPPQAARHATASRRRALASRIGALLAPQAAQSA